MHRMTRNYPLSPQALPTSFGARIEAMRAGGMSGTAIRRALGLSETEAIACGLVFPGPGRRHAGAQDDGPGRPQTGAVSLRVGGPGAGAAGPRMTEVVDAVARAGGLRPKDLLGRGQARPLTRARQLAMHLLRALCPGASLPAIGHLLGRDHTTVLYGCRRAAALLARDAAYRELRERACRELAAPCPPDPQGGQVTRRRHPGRAHG
jgi:hypothetical protein